MTQANSTGNNGHGPGSAAHGLTGTDLVNRFTRLTDMVYPGIRWHEQDYATLHAQLNFYDDFIEMSRFREGQVSRQQIVNPLDVAAALSNLPVTSGVLPPGTLFWERANGRERLGLYLPPQVWVVSVRDEDYLDTQGAAWQVPLPGLILVGHHFDYSLWAVKEQPPLTSDTVLYNAPTPNVAADGVCRGSAPFPSASAATMLQAAEVFFRSRFNHDLSNKKSKKHPERVLDHWYELNEAGATEYPLDDLVPEQHRTLRWLTHV
jgi:PRTRC genetic system protein B